MVLIKFNSIMHGSDNIDTNIDQNNYGNMNQHMKHDDVGHTYQPRLVPSSRLSDRNVGKGSIGKDYSIKKTSMNQRMNRSMSTSSFLRSVLSRVARIMMLMMITIMLFSSKISAWSDCDDAFDLVSNEDQIVTIEKNDVMLQEPTTLHNTIGKWHEQKEDQLELNNHMNDMITQDVALIHRMTQGCVTDEYGLQESVRNIPNNSLTSTNIKLCSKYIAMNVNNQTTSGALRYSGINLINKFVHFQCTLENVTEKCIIDAQQRSRHFYIQNSTASFDGIIFMNGNVMEDSLTTSGGSFWIEFLSKVEINDCDFIGGAARSGGAMYTRFSTIQMANVSFKNNVGGAIQSVFNSKVTITNGLLTNNSNNYGGAIDSMGSIITMKNVNLTNNIASEGGGAIKSDYSVISMTDVILANNSALKNGGVFSSIISNVTMTDVAIFDNNVKDGILTLLESNIYIQRVSFGAAAGIDTSDLLFGSFNIDDLDFQYSRLNLRETPPPQRETRSAFYDSSQIITCIYNCTALVDSVKNCKRTLDRKPCHINICSSNIQCSKTEMFSVESPIELGIDVSNKDIFFDCIPSSPTERCVLDGSSNTRLFYGFNTNVEFHKFIFANGFDAASGGAMKMYNDSVVSLSDCTFFNCSAPSGAAVSFNNTNFFMEGTVTSIINNTGNRASIELFSSNASLYNVFFSGNNYFSGNDASFYGSEIIMFDSTINAANLSFNIGNATDQCKIFVAVYNNDLTSKYSCLGMESVNSSTPIIISRPSVTIAPTAVISRPSVTTAPVAATPIVISGPSVTIAPTAVISTPSATTAPVASTPIVISGPSVTTSPTVVISRPSVTAAPITATSTAPIPTRQPTSCFSAGNEVQRIDGTYVRMDEVKIGDFIKSGNGKYTQIYGFGHMDPNKEAVFLQIYFGSVNRNQTEIVIEFSFLEISPMHLIYIDGNNRKYPIRASDVVIGDTLNGRTVTKIERVVSRGLYSPLTFSGDIIVNGVTASSYVDVLDHDWIWSQHTLGHILFFPQRIFCSYFMETCKKEKYINGYGYLAYIIIRGSSILQQGLLIVNNMILLLGVPVGFVIASVCVFVTK